MKRGLGLILILAAVAVGLWYVFFVQKPDQLAEKKSRSGGGATVRIRYGSEKKGFLDDADVQAILKNKYGLVVDGTKMGSLEMSSGSIEGVDALWPSSELAALLFGARHPQISFKKQNIFSTPIVFFSWPKIAEALVTAGVVETRENVFYVIKLKEFLDMVLAKRSWQSLGVSYQNGSISFRCTDPLKSNSGYLLSGLLAVVLNGGQMVDMDSIDRYIPTLSDLFKGMGYMENSSGILFDKYIKQGQGAFPVIANYESLMLEFYQAHPASREQIKKNIVVLIPEPTVWSEHPLVALTSNGQRLMEALQDEAVQQLAWNRFGFRTGAVALGVKTELLRELGLPDQIQSVTPSPAFDVMEKILNALQ